MIQSFVTQCPHCSTSFRVNLTQLTAAHGAVRCGACLHVFNAAEQLRKQGQLAAQATPATATPAPPASPNPQVAKALSTKPTDTLWIHDDLDLDNLDLDEELAKVDAQEQLRVELHNQNTTTPEHKSKVTTAPAAAITTAPEAPKQISTSHSAASKPTPSHSQKPDEVSLSSFNALDDDDLMLPAEADSTIIDDGLDENQASPAVKHRPAQPEVNLQTNELRHEPKLGGALNLDLSDEPLQLEWQEPSKQWPRRLAWISLNLLAAFALAGQYLWYHFDELARQDQYRPWFEVVCPSIGCTLPSKVDISQVKSSNLVVRSHPEFSGALVVDAILYNRAAFSQPFPLLELRFADIDGQLLASRRFKPSEYLAGELAGNSEMPPQTPIHISIDILDPGNQAVNYSLSFHSPE